METQGMTLLGKEVGPGTPLDSALEVEDVTLL